MICPIARSGSGQFLSAIPAIPAIPAISAIFLRHPVGQVSRRCRFGVFRIFAFALLRDVIPRRVLLLFVIAPALVTLVRSEVFGGFGIMFGILVPFNVGRDEPQLIAVEV